MVSTFLRHIPTSAHDLGRKRSTFQVIYQQPVVPGLKILSSKNQLKTIPQHFFVDIPEPLVAAVEAAKPEQVAAIGIEWAIQQSRDLLKAGVPCLHFYIMATSKLVKQVISALVLGSSNTVNKRATVGTRLWSRTLPNPGFCSAVKLLRSNVRGAFNFGVVCKGLSSECLSAEEPPPTFLQVQPTGTFGNEHLMEPSMVSQPKSNWRAEVTGEVIGNEVQIAIRIGLVNGSKQLQIALGIAGRCGQGQFGSIVDTQGTIHPHLIKTTTVF